MEIKCIACNKTFNQGSEEVVGLDSATVTFRPGVNIIIGRSGSGKTTLLRIASGLLTADSGSVLWGRNPLPVALEDRQAIRRRYSGTVLQAGNLVPELTVTDNVVLPAWLLGGKPSSHQVRKICAALGLEGKLQCFPHELSGGEQQRVAIARSIIHDPQIIFADEPTGSLDAATAEMVADLLTGRAISGNRTLLLATHDAHWLPHADAVYEMHRGRLRQVA